MADAYRALNRRERETAHRLAAKATARSQGAIGATLARAAVAIVASVQGRDGDGSTPDVDLRELRSDPALLAAKRADVGRAQALADELILAAIRAGYEDDGAGRSAIVADRSTGLAIAFEVSAADATRLASFPVVGFTAAELAARLAYQLDGAVDQTLALPLSGLLDAKTLPAALGEVGRLHALRVGNAVREAYFAGVRAATVALRRALTGA